MIVLQKIKHPFLISLSDVWKDNHNLYFLFPFHCGGELFTFMRMYDRWECYFVRTDVRNTKYRARVQTVPGRGEVLHHGDRVSSLLPSQQQHRLQRPQAWEHSPGQVCTRAWKRSIRRFVITEKAPTRAFSWLKVATTACTLKTLLRHYAKQALTPW